MTNTIQFPRRPNDRQFAALKAVVKTANSFPDTLTGEGMDGIGTLRALYRACGGSPKASAETLRKFAIETMEFWSSLDEDETEGEIIEVESETSQQERQRTAAQERRDRQQKTAQKKWEDETKRHEVRRIIDDKSDSSEVDLAQQLASILSQLNKSGVDEDAVRKIVDERMRHSVDHVREAIRNEIEDARKSVQEVRHVVEINNKGDGTTIEIENAHEITAKALAVINAGINLMLVGPAGSGKTHVCSQIASALGRPFYMSGAIDDVFTLTGFVMPSGECFRTKFRDAFEHGGVFLLDELDACAPEVPVAFNAALANDWFAFPDGVVDKHPEFVAIAATNTYGNGADRTYVGRYQLDGATLDRFATLDMDYDESLEIRLARAAAGDCDQGEQWARKVQRIRSATRELNIRMIVSMRASINGAALLAAGWDEDDVADAVLWKGASEDERHTIQSEALGA